MKLTLLLAIVVAATASYDSRQEHRSEWLESKIRGERRIAENEFRANREYQFFYNGQLSTGIPQTSQQHSVTRIQAVVSVVLRNEQTAQMKLEHVRFGRLNDDIPEPRKIVPFNAFEELPIEPDMLKKLHKPVEFRYAHGLISEIEFDGEEQPWSANIKRGVLNMLQVNLSKQRQVRSSSSSSSEQQNDQSNEFKSQSFVAMERSLEGECETMYTITSNPCRESSMKSCRQPESQQVLNITKSIEFEKCEKRPEVRYNERFQQICPTCEGRYNKKERSLRSSSTAKINLVCESVEQKKCVIEKSDVESQYQYVLFGEESSVISTYVRQTLELVKSGEIERQVPELSNKIRSDSDMLYSLDWDVKKEEFFMDGEDRFQQDTPFSKVENKIEFVKSVLGKLVHYMRESVEEEAPRQLARLVRVLRMLKLEELKQVHERFHKQTPEGFTREEHKKIKSLLTDAIALCGTKDCVQHLIHKIERNDITPLKASMAIRKLMEVRVPSKKMVEMVLEICEKTESKCEKHPSLKQAVYLTSGALMRALCQEDRDKLAIQSKLPITATVPEKVCSEETMQKYIEKLMREFESTKNEYEKTLILKSIGNAGLEKSIKYLAKIIRNQNEKYSTKIRVEAILALRQLVDQAPEKMVKLLMPIYMDKSESSRVRITAFYQIMQTAPDKLVIDQITRTLSNERHQQVAAFTYTMLQTLANTTNPCEKRMADDIKLALRQVRKLSLKEFAEKSKFVRWVDESSKKHKLGSSIDYATIKSSTSVLPKKLAISLNLNAAGQWSPRFVTVGFGQEGLGQILSQIWRSQSHKLQSSLDDLLSGKFQMPSPRFQYRSELKELFEKLNIEQSEEQQQQEESGLGELYLKFKNLDYGFVPLSPEYLPEELKELLSSENNVNELVSRAERHLKDVSIPFNYESGTFLLEQSRKIPTTLGLPIQVSVKMPTIVQASGIVKLEVDETSPLKKVHIVLKNMKPSIASTMVIKVEAWSPIVNSGLKLVASAKAFAPFEGSLLIDRSKSPAQMRLAVAPISDKREHIVSVQSRPITFTLVWPKFLQRWQEPEERTIYGKHSTRILTSNTEFGKHSLGIKFESRLQTHKRPEKHLPGSPIALLAGQNKYTLTMQPGYEMPKKFTVTITGNVFNKMDKKNVDVKFDKFFEDDSENFLSKESSEEKENERIQISEESMNYKGERPMNHEVRIVAKAEGSSIKREAELQLSSLCDEDNRSCRIKATVERTPVPTEETKPWKLDAQLQVQYPKTPISLSEITNEKRMVATLQSKWGEITNQDKKFNVKLVAEQSREMRQLKEQSSYSRLSQNEQQRAQFRSLFTPVAQYEHTLKYGLLDEIKADIDYKLSPSEKQLLNEAFRYFKNEYYGQTSVKIDGKKTSEGRVRAKLNIEPKSRQYANITVWTPFEETKLEDVPVWAQVRQMLNIRRVSSPSRSFYQLASNMISGDRSSRPLCQSRTDRITTFDSKELNVPTSTCYTVLSKDCSNKNTNKFAILIKKSSHSSEEKTLKIVTELTKLVIRAESEQKLRCEVNGEEKPCREIEEVSEHNDHVQLRCNSRLHERMLECELPEAGVKVYFDGYAADVKVSPMYRARTCGLCGNNDEETENEMRDQRRQPVSIRGLLESFIVKESEQETCQQREIDENARPEQLAWRQYSDDNTVEQREREHSFEEDYQTSIRGEQRSIRPTEQTKMVEQASQLCFSQQPVKQCPRGSLPIEYEQEKQRVVFTCFSQNDIQAELLERRVREQRKTEDLSSQPASFTEPIKVPKRCRQY